MKKFVLCMMVVAMAACGGDGPTAPSNDFPTGNSVAPGSVSGANPALAAPTAAEPETPTAPDPVWTLSGGNLTVNNHSNEEIRKVVLYFVNGPHPQQLLLKKVVVVAANANAFVPFPEAELWAAYGNEPEPSCEPQRQEIEVQIDIVNQINADNPSGNLGPTAGVEYVTISREFPGVQELCCVPTNLWSVKNVRDDKKAYDIVIVTDKKNPADTIVEGPFVLAGGESASFEGYDNTTLYAFFALPKKVYTYEYYTLDSGLENDCEAEGGVYDPSGYGSRCFTPVDHGTWWEFDHNDYAKKIGTDSEYITVYDFADDARSGSCEREDFDAAWQNDAKLKVECVCKQLDR